MSKEDLLIRVAASTVMAEEIRREARALLDKIKAAERERRRIADLQRDYVFDIPEQAVMRRYFEETRQLPRLDVNPPPRRPTHNRGRGRRWR